MLFKDFVEINPSVKLTKDANYPFVRMEDITPGRRYVSASIVRMAGGGAKFSHGDTLFARITPCLQNGKISQFRAKSGQLGFGSTEYWVFRAREGISDPSFIYYLANSHLIRKTAEKSMVGASGRQRAIIGAIEDLKIDAPTLKNQRQIAAILSAYDDLIENNSRRIAILEEMAMQIYEEWFVNYRFPGHEAVPLVESELGPVPEGWDVVSAADAVEVNPKVKVPKEGEKPFAPMGCLSEVNMLISNVEERAGNSGAKFQNGDTLFARITPCLENGKTAYVQFLPSPESVAFGSTEFIVLRSKKLTPEFVYLLARSDSFRNNAIKSMAGSDGRQRVKEACFASYMLALPDAKTLEKFHGMVHPMFDMIYVLARKNENLRQTRDLLLPRLISGELDVSTMPVPEDMAA